MERQCIYAKEVQFITGKSERHARNILNKIKKLLNKLPHQAVTIDEFSHYMGVNADMIKASLRYW